MDVGLLCCVLKITHDLLLEVEDLPQGEPVPAYCEKVKTTWWGWTLSNSAWSQHAGTVRLLCNKIKCVRVSTHYSHTYEHTQTSPPDVDPESSRAVSRAVVLKAVGTGICEVFMTSLITVTHTRQKNSHQTTQSTDLCLLSPLSPATYCHHMLESVKIILYHFLCDWHGIWRRSCIVIEVFLKRFP